jgi:flagellar biosynthesis protein
MMADGGRSPTKPPAQAAALRYQAETDRAPRIVAKGEGALAEQILRSARESGVPIHASHELVAALMQFELDQHIPAALYVAIAEVLAWAYRLEADRTTVPAGPHPGIPHVPGD